MITSLEELKKDRELVYSIDWEMTPESAVRVYLEWGNIYAKGDATRVRSREDHSIYFVVNCWDRPYYIYLIKRNSQEAVELARIELPERFEKTFCLARGVFGVEGDLMEWLKKGLDY